MGYRMIPPDYDVPTCPKCGSDLDYDESEHRIYCECGFERYLPRCGHCGKFLPNNRYAKENSEYGGLCKKCYDEEMKAQFENKEFDDWIEQYIGSEEHEKFEE